MKPFPPDLQRLITWARRSPEPLPIQPPSGFVNRVLASRHRAPRASWEMEIRWALPLSVWASLALILGGLVVFLSDGIETPRAYDFTPAYRSVAGNLVP